MSFHQYCVRNEEYHHGIQDLYPKGTYRSKFLPPKDVKLKKTSCKCYNVMCEFEERYTEIAKKYFDKRYEEENNYK